MIPKPIYNNAYASLSWKSISHPFLSCAILLAARLLQGLSGHPWVGRPDSIKKWNASLLDKLGIDDGHITKRLLVFWISRIQNPPSATDIMDFDQMTLNRLRLRFP